MSEETKNAITVDQPFEITSTPNIDRANRLVGLKTHPGFLDLVRISLELVKEASDVCTNFEGWDPLQITMLKARAQAAKEFHNLLFYKVTEAISLGVLEAKTQTALPTKTAQEIVDQSDYVRQAALDRFAQKDEMRAAGSY